MSMKSRDRATPLTALELQLPNRKRKEQERMSEISGGSAQTPAHPSRPAFGRVFAMPNAATFLIPPIRDFINRWKYGRERTIDPFARDSTVASFTNDLNPKTAANWHMEAADFLNLMIKEAWRFDLALFDPPYSPRQISKCYRNAGRMVGMAETQNAALYKRVRDALDAVMEPNGVVLSFGWNSSGMGKGRGYQLEELLLVQHGGAHNDTICIAERKAESAADTRDGRGAQRASSKSPVV